MELFAETQSSQLCFLKKPRRQSNPLLVWNMVGKRWARSHQIHVLQCQSGQCLIQLLIVLVTHSVKEQIPTSLNSTANKKGRCPKLLCLFRMYLNCGSRFWLTRFDGKNLPEGLERGKLVSTHEYRPQSTVWCNSLTKRSGSLKLVKTSAFCPLSVY